MIHQAKSYLTFLRKSKNQHSVHSPFVYDLLTKCFYNRQQHTAYEIIKSHRKSLLKDQSKIDVTDLGAGSLVFSGSKRQISKLVKHAGIKPKRAKLLNRLTRYLNVENALELGTSVGLGSVAISAGNPNTKITTLEGCPSTAKIADTYFKQFSLKNIQLINSEFDRIINTFKTPFDLIFIDGNHTKEATLKYFEKLLKLTHNNSVIIFDDIYLNKYMTEAWQYIVENPKVTVSIDTYKWGMVFFREEQAKEDFVVRV